MRVLVCGSRDWTDYEAIGAALDRLPEGSTIIHGAARGADSIAANIAWALGHKVERFPARWRSGGVCNPGAGFERNLAMLDTAPDLVLAFQRNSSRGTQHVIDEARRRGIRVEVHAYDTSSVEDHLQAAREALADLDSAVDATGDKRR